MSGKPEKIQPLVGDIKTLIAASKQQVAVAVNATMSILYWNIGTRINREVLQEQRAEYGKQIVSALSRHLTEEFGAGWSVRQLHHYIPFADIFSEIQIVHTLCTQLSWSHIRQIIPMENEIKHTLTK